MSRTQSHSVQSTPQSGFSLHISAVGKGKTCPAHLRSPAALHVPLSATYYDLPSGIDGPGASGSTQTPWVGHVDLERRYFDEYSIYDSPGAGPSRPPPIHPGLEIAPFGQLQILVKSACAPVKVFIVPYDLRRIPLGGRLLIRERTVVEAAGDKGSRTFLRYAIQLRLSAIRNPAPMDDTSGPATTRARSVTPALDDPTEAQRPLYFLSRSLKVIFAAHPPESSETTRTDRHDEVVLPSPGRKEDQSGANREWEMLRQKWIARRDLQHASSHPPTTATALPFSVGAPISIASKRDASPPRFEKSPIPQRTVLPHIPLLEPIQSADASRVPSRSATPVAGLAVPDLPLVARDRSRGGRKQRQGSSSREDKELSEKLRALGLS